MRRVAGVKGPAMSEREGALDRSGNEPGQEASPAGEASPADEAALIREVVRMQKRHREGGIDPDLDEEDRQPESEAPG
jgi:hypothetical protein